MPSNSKKKSKSSASKQSSSEYSESSPRTPLVNNHLDSDVVSEEDLRSSVIDASSRFPTLIGSSALISRITHVDFDSRGCKIWLSEPAMVASSLSPGSIVSVSLAASRRRISNSFPLGSFMDECAEKFGDSVEEMGNEVGTYFAIATVYPSTKVLKDGARLSCDLLYTMGSPASGRILFIYPLSNQSMINESHQLNGGVDHLRLHNCKELYLDMVTCIDGPKRTGGADNVHDRTPSGLVSSPKTPLYQSKLTSPIVNELATPYNDSTFNSANTLRSQSNIVHIREMLADENAKKLLQTCATSWLYSRCLLYGNLVTIPILSELCIFHVVGANSSPESADEVMSKGKSTSLDVQDTEAVNHKNEAFAMKHDTKIYLSLRSNSESDISQRRSSSHLQLQFEEVKARAVYDHPELGGLSKEYATLKDIIIQSSKKNGLSSFGLRTTKGVLLRGPPGTGKTTLAQLCARDAGVNLFPINGPEIISQYHGESEQALLKVFDSASQALPSVVFIDELDAIAPARKDGSEELSQRMVATLLNLMDGISRSDGVLVVAATNRPDSIEPALRRPGRLDKEIEIGVPSPKQRLDILYTILRKMEHSLADLQIQQLATTTHGFVGADIAALCNEAALVCLRRFAKLQKSCVQSDQSLVAYEGRDLVEVSDSVSGTTNISRDCSDSASSHVPNSGNSLVSEVRDNSNEDPSPCSETTSAEEEFMLKVSFEDIEKARMKIRPSAMREVILEVPKVNWKDVGGQWEVKNQLMEAVEWPQKHRDAFTRIGTRPPTGVLLFGPPGCSKTLMARAVASEAGLNFLAVKGPELFSKWVGESEKAVRSLFAKARANAPSIIFFDEIDGLAVIRGKESDGVSVSDRVMSQLLVELDGLHERVDVTVIAATNRPDKIDPALLRPGRFDRILYVGPPSESDREEIFGIHLRKIPCSSDVSIKELASLTKGCTGADISLICREAAISAIEESLDATEITMPHLRAAIGRVKPSESIPYQELSARFQRLAHSSTTEKFLGFRECFVSFISENSMHISWIGRTMIKSSMQFVYRLPSAILHSKDR
ncbi:calmodulin-interacting protein 111-like [Rutidosis leptorrhynchoides]|uniref:calmodulin-interacting protein 111-like n=1 Tax=Rutidosis leptorrhynchoides TaxID=125765 RepID=UPI003A9999B5